jgi:hypothetical protein
VCAVVGEGVGRTEGERERGAGYGVGENARIKRRHRGVGGEKW